MKGSLITGSFQSLQFSSFTVKCNYRFNLWTFIADSCVSNGNQTSPNELVNIMFVYIKFLMTSEELDSY